jgi:hypothetical protein
MAMKQTAVDWLVEKLKENGVSFWQEEIEMIEEAKEMEKKAHQETWDVAHQAGRFEGKGIAEKDWQTFETHWKETFKSE